MQLNNLIKSIHQNAVDHGWWEGTRSLAEIIALIHSEWSEALEEARAGRPNLYRICVECMDGPCFVTPEDATLSVCDYSEQGKKPEGIAVELIDGCIRIFDLMGNYALSLSIDDHAVENVEDLYAGDCARLQPVDTAELVADLHNFTSLAYDAFSNDMMDEGWTWIAETLIKALSWVKGQGLDPLALLMVKCEYNKTRPYKHGKQF